MKKILIKYTIIIFVNLFAFLWVWYILNAFFNSDGKILIMSLVLSVISLVIISYFFMKWNLNKLNNITEKENEWK